MSKPTNNFASFLQSMEKGRTYFIYLNNNVVIMTEPEHLQFFKDYFIFDGKSTRGTMYFPDQDKIYPKGCERLNEAVPHLNVIPYSAVSLITG